MVEDLLNRAGDAALNLNGTVFPTDERELGTLTPE
jgi:hypothetical protein